MTDILCGYTGRDETIVAYLYNEIDPAERRLFQQHLLTCTTCRDEVAAFKTVQKQLARWDPPLPASISNREINPQSTIRNPQSRSSWWRAVPAWAQVAAALLFFGVSAGVANLDVRYDASGLSVRTGWSGRAAAQGKSGGNGAADAPWRADLARMEQQLKSEMRAAAVSAAATPSTPMVRNTALGAAASADADTV
jgi:anti-sigma factor RsiW